MACLLKQVFFSFWLSFGSCLCEFAWCGFSLIFISIYYLRNHLFHIILTLALPVGLNSWNYQQTFLKYGVLFLIPCHVLSCEDDLVYLYSPGNYFLMLIVLGQLIFTFVVEYFCSSSYWLLLSIALFIAKCFCFYSLCLPCLLYGS